MRIRRVRVQGFRCLEDVDIPLDDVTTLIGPNAVGKSSLLRALDWFFNGSASAGITHEDLSANAPDCRVRVEVEFAQLTSRDREQLGCYAPEGADRVLLWRTWTNGAVFSGNARSYPAFAAIRAASSAIDKRRLYADLRSERSELGLPTENTAPRVEDERSIASTPLRSSVHGRCRPVADLKVASQVWCKSRLTRVPHCDAMRPV
ncbi:MAG: ATP-dependent nuclease [Acidimicrobiales bacterium]